VDTYAACRSVLQCIAVRCSVLQRAADVHLSVTEWNSCGHIVQPRRIEQGFKERLANRPTDQQTEMNGSLDDTYRVAKTHRYRIFYISFSAKEPY